MLTHAPLELLACESSEGVARRLREAVEAITAGDVTISLRDGARLVTVAPEGGQVKAELYRSGPTRTYINHGLEHATLVAFLAQGEDVAGRLVAVLREQISEETIEAIEALVQVATVRILQLEGDTRFRSLVNHEREFLDRFAHDMKTPLTAILGMAQTLQRQDRLTPELRAEFLERIEASSRDLERILEEGRAKLKAKSASLSIPLEECDLHSMLAEAVHYAREGITVTIENFPGAPCVAANPALLAEVLQKTVLHSTTRAATGIRIEISRSGEWVEIKVADDGPEPDPGTYNDELWFRGRLAMIGRTPGDPLELVAPARDLQTMGGQMVFETDGGKLTVVVILPVASAQPR